MIRPTYVGSTLLLVFPHAVKTVLTTPPCMLSAWSRRTGSRREDASLALALSLLARSQDWWTHHMCTSVASSSHKDASASRHQIGTTGAQYPRRLLLKWCAPCRSLHLQIWICCTYVA
ncbi:hypothetical protein DFH06DRAFT_753244 [Mycena polygramma]|nr:hypothetical protein DFH06DRAFT_753244 [Mycena polygramma]